jgi:hypothetical protein
MVYGNKKMIYMFTFFLLLYIYILPVCATSTAQLLWTKQIGDTFNYPTYVDTWDNGTVVYVGLVNGTILSLDVNGDTRWSYPTNGSIKRIVANANGTVAWINTHNESGTIPDNVDLEYYYPDHLRNITDVGISRDGNYYAITELSPSRVSVISNTGSIIQNASFGIANWTNIAYDPYSKWIVTSNLSDTKLYLWNLTIYTGWLDFNPIKSNPKNSSQLNLDTFPYRRNLSISNFNALTHIIFLNSSVNSTTINQINQSVYQYYPINTGKYLYFTTYGNFTDNGNCVNSSYISDDILTMTFMPTCTKNMTLYYGNKSYVNENYTSVSSYSLYGSVGSYTFSIPAGVTSVGYTISGGGGGGGGSSDSYYYGLGGSVGSVTTGTLSIPSGQTTISIVVGDGGAGASGTGASGGSSILNGTLIASGGAGGVSTAGSAWHSGGSGYSTIYTGISATAGQIGTYDGGSGCLPSGGAAGTAGSGYGSGGGGGGASGGGCVASGGKGARGFINITYGVRSSPIGIVPTNAYLTAQQTQSTDNSMNYIGTQTLSGNISDMDAPEMGGWLSASTDSPKIYHQQITTSGLITGFGTQYSGTANTGNSKMIRTSDSAAYSVEARDLMADIYQLDGTRKGTYTTGGIVNSVDVAVKNGLWAVSGGDDGKVYIFSKDSTSSWYVYYQGDTGEIITSIASSWRGEYVIVGRVDGNIEYYTTSGTTTTASNYMVNVFVNKGGVSYSGAAITVTTGSSPETAVSTYYNGKTDSSGKFSFTGEDLKYYKINVNNDEYIYVYQASSTYTTVTINVPVPMITRPYDYVSTYDSNTNTILTTYNDVDIASLVNVTVIDMTINKVVQETSYNSVTSVSDTCNIDVNNKSHEFKVNIEFTRTTGHTYTDTIYVRSSSFLQPVTVPTTQWLLFKYAIYSIMLMFVALGIGAASTKWGVVLLPALTVLGIMIGFLPLNIYTGGLLVSAFIAMSEVMRRRQD